MLKKFRSFYPTLSIITISAVYLLILVGGIVRSTGSGMGCPDWPKCFGSYIPPTDVSQLPKDYKDVYSNQRHIKNVRMADYLDFFGYDDIAYKLRNDESIRIESDFNVTKTWIEYINRLIGVIIGLLIFATLVASVGYLSKDILVFIYSFLAFVLVGFQGWLGSIVVSTNLLPGMITIHMLLALVIVGILIFGYFQSSHVNVVSNFNNTGLFRLTLMIVVLYLIKIVFGTQVREAIDSVAFNLMHQQREMWIDSLGVTFYIHRSYSLFIFGLNAYLVYLIYNEVEFKNSLILRLGRVLIVLLFFEILSGALMSYLAIPAFLQPIHLTLAAIIFGLQVYLLLLFRNSTVLNKADLKTEILS
jgi:cytochrome c oxidase assembly protein subunit 15